MLINDTTWCFDEGMNKLAEIKKYQIKLREGQPIDDEEHKNYEGNIKYCGFVM